jgi:acetyl-CoA C-acetyltransferase
MLARVARRNLRNAVYNPYAHRRGDFSEAQIMASPLVADPLRELHCPSSSDGACAVLLADEEMARKLHPQPAWVQGFGWAAEGYDLGERDLLASTALAQASRDAYSRARIQDPSRDLEVVELAAYAHQEPLWYEGLGLCPPGEGWRLIREGTTEMEGPLPVNPSGGILATNPGLAQGLFRVAEAALQLWGKAGSHQVKGSPKRAVAHSTYGLVGQAHAVVVLGRD